MKRILLKITALTLALLLAVSLCSCSTLRRAISRTLRETLSIKDPDIVDGDSNPYLNIEPQALSYSEGYTPVVSRYSRDALPLESEQLLYDKLVDSFYDISSDLNEEAERYPMPEVRLEGFSLSEAQVRTTIKAILDDRPEIFWPCGTVGYYADEELTIVQVYSRLSPDEVSEKLTAVREAASAFYAEVPDGLSAYQRELTVHDYLAQLAAYDVNVDAENADNNDPELYTVYGALVNKLTVCEGYARAFQLLLNGLGVDCVNITGTSDGELHMWSEVKLGENWYAVDLTWDDREESYSRYCYFNLTSEQMAKDHTTGVMFDALSDDEINGVVDGINADIMNIVVPDCTDATMSWFYQETPHLDDYEGAAVKNALLAAARNGDTYFALYIGEEMDFDGAVDALFKESPQYFFDYVASVNAYLEDYSIDSSNVSYIAMPTNRAVTVELHYY